MKTQITNQPFTRLSATAAPLVIAACMALLLVGCGTMSPLTPAQAGHKLDFSTYSKVIVNNFEDKTTGGAKPTEQESKNREMQRVCRDFADRVADEIEKTHVFESASRNGTADASTLLIGGNITRYEEGNAAARYIGFGAGSSYFGALVEFRQGSTGELLGTISVDKNSWVGGGDLAVRQTPEGFMQGAAVKVADEIKKTKKAP